MLTFFVYSAFTKRIC